MKQPSFPLALLFSLILFLTFWTEPTHAQSDKCPRIYREGETLRTDPAQSYQWYKNGEIIPNATQQTYTPSGRSASYAVQVEGKASTPFAFELGQVTLIGQAFDEHLRPVANARIAVGNQTTQSDAQGRFQLGPISASTTILLRGEKAGHWTSQRRITHTGRETHVQLMLRSQPFEHELSAERGGTISRGAFFLTLQPNGVLDANNQRYTGVVKIALNGGRPDDPHFGWMMPGGDFMAQDAQGRERILQSYGFLSAHLQTPSGQPLKLDPTIGAQLRFVMPHTMVASAPDGMPLWHFDETAGIWKEEGFARREGAAYVGTVRHFSSWNCDWPGPWCLLRGKTVDCKGRPVAGAPLHLGQQIINSDNNGLYSGRVPATLRFDVQSMNGVAKITVGPFVEGSENVVQDLTDGSSLYGFGVIDSANLLVIRSYGTSGRVNYSIDSFATQQASNTFTTQIDSNYMVFINDSIDCPTKVDYIRLGRKAACKMLDSAALSLVTEFSSIESALLSEEPVYKLSLARKGFSEFPNNITYFFPCVHRLDLSEIDSAIIPTSIHNLTSLQELYLYYCKITTIPESVSGLSQLRSLGLGGNQLTKIPESIGNLTQLRELDLSSNQLTRVPESIGNLTQLQRLWLDANNLPELPGWVANLTQLQDLNFSNQLITLPDWIGNLKELRMLHLFGNGLTELPESVGNLIHMKVLVLNQNRLTTLPESIGNLTQLQDLWLDDNQLTEIPNSIGNLTQLDTLYLSMNQLTNLPESFGNLTKLKLIRLVNNQLTSLPQSIGNLSQLESLDLMSNQLISLPESFGNISPLQSLYLSYNQLSSLPQSFQNLKELDRLSLSNNQFSALPELIGSLTKLQSLELHNNNLTSLPESIGNLSNLQTLSLTGNPIPPAEQSRIKRLLPRCQIVF